MLDPVAAYDRMAGSFARLSEERRAYLEAIERLIVSAIPSGSKSLLDIGAGDGTRASRIARAAGLKDVVLLEPSEAMRRSWPAGVTAWPVRAEDLHGAGGAVRCGHLPVERARAHLSRKRPRGSGPAMRPPARSRRTDLHRREPSSQRSTLRTAADGRTTPAGRQSPGRIGQALLTSHSATAER